MAGAKHHRVARPRPVFSEGSSDIAGADDTNFHSELDWWYCDNAFSRAKVERSWVRRVAVQILLGVGLEILRVMIFGYGYPKRPSWKAELGLMYPKRLSTQTIAGP